MEESNRPILVTGGAGFIGGNFVLDLVGTHKVINLDALTYAGNLDTLAPVAGDPGHVFVRGSIGDRPLVEGLLAEHRPRAIVNFAAETHVDRSIDGPKAFVQTNVVETLELLEAALAYWQGLEGEERLGSASCTSRQTRSTAPWVPKGSSPRRRPTGPTRRTRHPRRPRTTWCGRSTTPTGCRPSPPTAPTTTDPTSSREADTANDLQRPARRAAPGLRRRAPDPDWLYVKDHCRAVVRVLEAGTVGEVYNVGGHNERTNLEVVETVCSLLDALVPDSSYAPHASLIAFVEDRPGHDRRYAIDATKIERELGWRPDETFESGMEKTVKWYLENKEWCEGVLSGNYRGERLGLGDGRSS